LTPKILRTEKYFNSNTATGTKYTFQTPPLTPVGGRRRVASA